MRQSMYLILLIFIGPLVAQGQETNAAIRKGNLLYKKGDYPHSIPENRKAVELEPTNPVANYNFGNALFRNNNFDESIKAYNKSIESTKDDVYRERAYYNKGVSYSQQKKLVESINAYKSALKIDPNDEDARHNLQKALYELKKQNQQKENQEKEEEKKQDQNEKQKEKPRQQQSKLNKKQVENLLKALQQKEQDVQKKMQQNKTRAAGQPDKDW